MHLFAHELTMHVFPLNILTLHVLTMHVFLHSLNNWLRIFFCENRLGGLSFEYLRLEMLVDHRLIGLLACDVLSLLVNDRLVNFFNHILMFFMDDWLMMLMDVFFCNYRLVS